MHESASNRQQQGTHTLSTTYTYIGDYLRFCILVSVSLSVAELGLESVAKAA